MRILDVDLKEAMQDMPDEVLYQITREIDKEFIHIPAGQYGYLRSIPGKFEKYVDEHILANVINKIRNENNLGEWEGLKANGFVNGEYQKPERVIPLGDIFNLVSKVVLMRKTEKLRSDYRGKSSQEIQEEIYSMIESDVDRSTMDEKYGLTYSEKFRGLSDLCTEAGIQECVRNLSKEELDELRVRFEDMRNKPQRGFDFPSYESAHFVRTLFGNEPANEPWVDRLNLSDIAEAFEAREQELQKPAKSNFWDKLKNAAQSVKSRVEEIFSRFGRKALPEPVPDKQTPKIPSLRESIVPEGGKTQYQQHAKAVADKFNAQPDHTTEVKDTDKDLDAK